MNYDTWNKWTEKSSIIPFVSKHKTIGNGEEKLAYEFDTSIQGQNRSYDMEINGEEIECKCLDNQHSFRIGVRIHPLTTEIIRCLLEICETLPSILNNIKNISSSYTHILTNIHNAIFIHKQTTKCKHSIYDGLQKHEVCASNLDILSRNIELLKNICFNNHFSEMKTIYHPINGTPISVTIENTYNIMKTFSIENSGLFQHTDEYVVAMMRFYLKDKLKKFAIASLQETLDYIVRGCFVTTRLVVVDEKKGYFPVDNLSCLRCLRITSGNLRGSIQNI